MNCEKQIMTRITAFVCMRNEFMSNMSHAVA